MTNWTNPQTETLSRLWTQGMTANQIAGVLGEGVTRNAVIGKLHRLGLSVNDKHGARPQDGELSPPLPQERNDEAAVTASGPMTATPHQDIVIAPKARHCVTIAELIESMCRWPAEEQTAEGFLYCGEPVQGGAPYCEGHCKLAYQPSKPLRRKPDRNMLLSGIVIQAPK